MSNYFIFFLYTNRILIHQVSWFSFSWYNFIIFGVQMLLYSNQSTWKFVVSTIGISSFCVSFVKSIFVYETFYVSFFFLLLVVFFCVDVMYTWFFLFFRNNLSLKTVSGESKVVMPEMVAGWNEITLPTLLSNFDLENIYNANKFGLFYQCLPDKSYQLKTENCSGGKHSKIRITGLVAANAVGNKLLLVKQKILGVLKTLRNFPVTKKELDG